jgi:hypothetical protein
MPYMLREGPFILKDYAFEWYGHTEPTGTVSATRVIFEVRDGEVVPVRGWGPPKHDVPDGAEVLRL